jgi:hypothetical protein
VVRERYAGGRDVVAVGRLEDGLAAVEGAVPVGAAAEQRVAPAARGLDVQALTADRDERAEDAFPNVYRRFADTSCVGGLA